MNDGIGKWGQMGQQLVRIYPLFNFRAATVHLLQISKRPKRKLAAALRRKLLGAPPQDTLNAHCQLWDWRAGVPPDVIRCIVDRVIHQVVRGIAVVQVRPGAKNSVRPSCLRSGVQHLIGGWMPR